MNQALLIQFLFFFWFYNDDKSFVLIRSQEIDSPSNVSIDQSGNIYLATYDGNIVKYSPDFNDKQIFSPSRPNATTALEAWQGLRIFSFHEELQTYRLINRNLSLAEDYSFNPNIVGYAEIATTSFDNNLWVIDQTDFSLKKININTGEVESSSRLNLLLDPDNYEIHHCREYQNRLFISTRNKGILIFDSFGTYLKNYNYPGIDYFNFDKDNIYFIRDNQLVFINLYDETVRSIDLPTGEKWLFALVFNRSTYLFSAKSINLYQ